MQDAEQSGKESSPLKKILAPSSRCSSICVLTMAVVGIGQLIVLVVMTCYLIKISDAYNQNYKQGFPSQRNFYDRDRDYERQYGLVTDQQELSVTEYSTRGLPEGRPKRGQLIFQEEFNDFDLERWSHEITASGGGNWEFQVYENNRSNSYCKYGKLYIKPTLTEDKYGKGFLTSGHLQLGGGAPADACTNPSFFGCDRKGGPTNIINPIISARIRTINSFAFKYGKVHVRAKIPTGDWLWPAIWLLPLNNKYSGWPSSGEIDIMESRGNEKLFDADKKNIGVERIGSTLHYGPFFPLNGWDKAHFVKQSRPNNGFNNDFFVYGLEWTPDYIKFTIDDEETGRVSPPGGFWELGQFPSELDNPWRYSENEKMAPFDQKFYLIMNLAVGGTNGFFPDTTTGPRKKPWFNNSTQAFLDFWNKKSDWYPTWRGENAALQVDYVRVWAL